jgi:hypothetical protein
VNNKLMKKIEAMLADAAQQKTWGCIEIDLKDGRPILLRQTTQTKINEDFPNGSSGYGNTR